MTGPEWRAKYGEARRAYEAEVADGRTALDWEAWRKQNGYIVDHQPGARPQ